MPETEGSLAVAAVKARHFILEHGSRIRKASGTTLGQIGRDLRVSGGAVHLWETGQRRIPPHHAIRYQQILIDLEEATK